MVNRIVARLAEPRWSRDLVGAGALVALLCAVLWTVNGDLPPIAWSVCVGAGLCGWLFLATVTRTTRVAHGRYEVRALLLIALLLAQTGFVLRLGPGQDFAAAREWAVFLLGALLFIGTYEVARRVVPLAVWAVVAGVLFAGAATAVVLTPHQRGPRLLWEHTRPASVLAVAVAGVLAVWWVRAPRTSIPEAVRAYVVAVPPLAMYAFTRDPGAAALMLGATAGAAVGAGRLSFAAGWSATLRPVGAGIAATTLVGAGFRLIDPAGIFTVDAAEPVRDILGVWQSPLSDPLTLVGGQAGNAVLVLLVLLFAAQVALMAARPLYGAESARPERAAGPDPKVVQRIWGVALGGQLLVSLLAPAMFAAFGRSGPASLTTLPIAADGASFVITFAALGIIAASSRRDISSEPAVRRAPG